MTSLTDATVQLNYDLMLVYFTWHASRKTDVDKTLFDKWKVLKKNVFAALVVGMTDFEYATLEKYTEDFIRIKVGTGLTAPQLKFLSYVPEMEAFGMSDYLLSLVPTDPLVTDMSKLSIGAKKVIIEKFTGTEEDPEEWFDLYQMLAKAEGWNNELMAIKIPSNLAETPALVYQTMTVADKKDFDKIKEEMIKKFGTNHSHESNFFAFKQKDTDSVVEYSLKLEKLGLRAFGSSTGTRTKIIEAFKKGVVHRIKKGLIQTSATASFEELVSIAKKIEEVYKENKEEEKTILSIQPQADISSQRDSRSPDKNRYEDRRRSNSRGYDRCHKCGEIGHKAPDCRADPYADKRPLKCYRCDKPGHIARDCMVNLDRNSDQRYRDRSQSNSRGGDQKQYRSNTPGPSRYRNNTRDSFKCYRCGKEGHLSRNCRNNNLNF